MSTLADRYKGPVEVGMVFTCPDNDGVLGYRRLKVIADLGEGTLVLGGVGASIDGTADGEPSSLRIWPSLETNTRLTGFWRARSE